MYRFENNYSVEILTILETGSDNNNKKDLHFESEKMTLNTFYALTF